MATIHMKYSRMEAKTMDSTSRCHTRTTTWWVITTSKTSSATECSTTTHSTTTEATIPTTTMASTNSIATTTMGKWTLETIRALMVQWTTRWIKDMQITHLTLVETTIITDKTIIASNNRFRMIKFQPRHLRIDWGTSRCIELLQNLMTVLNFKYS